MQFAQRFVYTSTANFHFKMAITKYALLKWAFFVLNLVSLIVGNTYIIHRNVCAPKYTILGITLVALACVLVFTVIFAVTCVNCLCSTICQEMLFEYVFAVAVVFSSGAILVLLYSSHLNCSSDVRQWATSLFPLTFIYFCLVFFQLVKKK